MNELLRFTTEHGLLSEYDNDSLVRAMQAFTNVGQDDPRSFMDLPEDEKIVTQVEETVRAIDTGALTHVLLVGIGGSSLGARAVASAHQGPMKKLLVAETVSPYGTKEILRTIQDEVKVAENLAVVIVSKSGTTTETAAHAGLFLAVLKERFGDIADRVAVVTDEGSVLAAFADKEGYKKLFIPKAVGGRYSIFSAAGLLPLALAGVPVRELVGGARKARAAFLAEGVSSLAVRYGAALVSYARQGFRAHNLFVFEPMLEDAGKWWRQLVGESLGKDRDRAGDTTHMSILPVVSVGSTDLHSVGQLYLSGAPGIATTFVCVGVSANNDLIVPKESAAESLVPGLNGRTYLRILDAIVEGTERAYTEKQLPFTEFCMADLSLEAVGAFMETQMIAIALTGELMGVNAFDQPNVEDYKRHTREVLSAQNG